MDLLKALSFFSFIMLLSCSSPSKQAPVEERVEEDMPAAAPTVKFVPTDQDRETFDLLKSRMAQVNETTENFLTEGNHIGYPEIKYVQNKYLTNLYGAISESANLDEFLTQQKQVSRDYKKELNTVGLIMGYGLIEEYGNKKDEVAFGKIQNQIRALIAAGIINEPKLIRYKLYEKELNTKMNPAKGAGKTDIKVDNNGKITINGSMLGVAVESNGELILQPAQFIE